MICEIYIVARRRRGGGARSVGRSVGRTDGRSDGTGDGSVTAKGRTRHVFKIYDTFVHCAGQPSLPFSLPLPPMNTAVLTCPWCQKCRAPIFHHHPLSTHPRIRKVPGISGSGKIGKQLLRFFLPRVCVCGARVRQRI